MPDRSLDYRGYWTIDAAAEAGWTREVVAQAASWLSPKVDQDIDLSSDGIWRSSRGHRLEIRRHEQGSERALRFVMEEENQGGRFVTSLTAVESVRGDGWLSLDVVNERGDFVNRPRLAGYLLDVLSLKDGTRMSSTPQRVGSQAVDDVLAALREPERHGPVLVAATNTDMPFDAFADLVQEWSRETVGLAQTFVLDPLATTELNARLGRRWGVPEWTVRTYLPGIDVTNPAGARANRILGTARLGGDRDAYLAKLLGSVARSIIADRPVPPAWRAWQRTFDRIATAAIVTSATPHRARERRAIEPVPAPTDLSPEVTRLEQELERVRVTLELSDLSESALLELLDQATSERVEPERLLELQESVHRQQRRAEAAESKLDAAQYRILELDDRADRADSDAEDLDRRVRYLTKALVEADRPDLAYGQTPDEDAADLYGAEPLTFAELLERVTGFEPMGVVYTGDRKYTEELELLDDGGRVLQMAWEAVVTLCEYVRAKREIDYDGSVHKFLEDQLAGYRCYPANQHAPTETGFTKKQFKNTRRFPVPDSVHRKGQVDMFEHFKIARVDHQDPRLHYYDDTRKTGSVYVGYLGVHLVNSKTDQ